MTIRLLSYVFVALIAFAGGFLVGNWNVGDSADESAEAGAAANAADQADAPTGDSKIPIGDSPILGKDSAIITVVEFSDFQCPFCKRGADTVKKLQEKYPNDVKVAFKHYPLPFHKQAVPAHKAAIAAKKQGKFWEMHDFFFNNQKSLKGKSDAQIKEWAAGQAKELGMDVAKFKKDFDDPATQKQIDQDMALGKEVAVRGTPHFFVNGERVKGAKPLPAFESIVKEQLKEAKEMLQAGTKRPQIYDKMVAKNFDKPSPKPDRGQKKKKAQKVEFVPIEKADPVFGNTEDPLVTIVEFSDFQCPFCDKVVPTINKIKKEYGDQVRVAFKQLPLGMHAQAKPAAKASLAAAEQGKFWEMHDKLFENQKAMRQHGSDFKEWSAGLAKEIGLNVDKFKKDYDSPAIAQKVDRDTKLAQKVGARGTPNFWINGINLRGAQPYPRFKSTIDQQIKLAKKLKEEKNLSGDALYKAMVAINKKNAPKAEANNKPQRDKPAPKVDPSKLKIGDAPTKGPDNAPVTIIEFSEFQCPYCKRGTANLDEALADFKGKVKVAFKHYPLPFHKQARPASKAAMAAHQQGKFWEMHDLLFQNQKQLRQDGLYEKLAKQLGLNMAQFKKDMNDPKWDKMMDAHMKQGQAVGVRGTPAFFINGTRLVGAQPTSKFKQVIEQALKEAK